MANCRFKEDTEKGMYCSRFNCACDNICEEEAKCDFYIDAAELSEEEIDIMREVAR